MTRRKYSFEIDRAIHTWRQFLNTDDALTPDDKVELEIHLRDEIDACLEKGMSEEEAFGFARRATGDLAGIHEAFSAVATEKVFTRDGFGPAFRDRVGIALVSLRIATRAALRHKSSALLNTVGLSLGLSAVIVIGLFIVHSLSYDTYHEDVDRVYRVTQERGDLGWFARPSEGIAGLIRDSFENIDAATAFRGSFNFERQLTVGSEHYMTKGVLSVDEYFADVITISTLQSASQSFLREPYSIALTLSTARRLFGDADALGQVVRLDAGEDYTVTAILEDTPSNTHLPFLALARPATPVADVNWNRWGARVYVKLAVGASPEHFEAQLNEMYASANPGALGSFDAESLTDVYLKSRVQDDYNTTGDVSYLYLFGSIGFLVLLLASINYMNLATARALKRSREIGVRKVVGASRATLIRQFLVESTFLSLTALPIALILSWTIMPTINAITGEQISLGLLLSPGLIITLLVFVLVTGLGSGFYPALMLSGFRPASVLSAVATAGRQRRMMRRILVGVQVAASFAMLVSTVLISRQLTLMQDRNLGFDQEQVITFTMRGWDYSQFSVFRNNVLASPAIAGAASGPPPGVDWRNMTWTREFEDTGETVEFALSEVGPQYFETIGMSIEEGRGFLDGDNTEDSTPVVVSASYAELYKKDGTVIGQETGVYNGRGVVGVVSDIQNVSFHDSDRIMLYSVNEEKVYSAIARLNSRQTREGLQALAEAWNVFEPDRPFVYQFLDQQIQEQYVAETKLGRVFTIFAVVSVFIACLGLFGLAAFTAEQRTREIGIRKALGATVFDIVSLLSKDFVGIVALAIVFVAPAVFWAGNSWLTNFTLRVEPSLEMYLLSAAVILGIVLCTISIQSIRAAVSNPTDALRHE